jgi:hypothetical protein
MLVSGLVIYIIPCHATDQVVIVKHNKLAQPQVTTEGRCFRGNALLQAAITADDVGVVIHNGEARLVEATG